MIPKRAAAASQPLDLRILELEQRLLVRRRRIAGLASRFGAKARARTSGSPGMLVAGFGLGVFLHRSTRRDRDHRSWTWVHLINAIYAGGSIAMTLSSWVGAAPRVQTGDDRDQRHG